MPERMPPWMIDEIKQDEEKVNRRRDANRPRVYIDDMPWEKPPENGPTHPTQESIELKKEEGK
jgi:hypothetical protein